MRMMMKVQMQTEASNRAIKDGSLPKTMSRFIETWHPEASYFVAENGMRTAYFVFDLKDATMIPSAAEAFFIHFNASIQMMPAMNAEDMRTGIDRAMKQANG